MIPRHPPQRPPPACEAGALLRQWRERRGQSQLALSLRSGVSQRHISYVESGRSALGRDTLSTLADALDIPLRDRNTLLLAAGFAPAYADAPWDADDNDAVTNALRRVLRQHEPFPAVVLDRYWTVLLTNEAAPRFFGRFVDLSAWPKPRNLLRLMFDPAGVRSHLLNWSEAANALVQRIHREAVGRVIDERTEALLAELRSYPGVPPRRLASDAEAPAGTSPVVPLTFALGGRRLSYFSLVSTVGTPQTVVAQELRVECMFPADDATERAHVELMRTIP